MSAENIDEGFVEITREEKIVKAKELYSKGSRDFLVKSYDEAADELSQVCSLYEEVYGELSDELGMPYLLYAKSLIALALDENKVIDVPEVDGYDDDNDEDDDDEEEGDEATSSTTVQKTNGVADEGKQKRLESIKEDSNESDRKTTDEADSTGIIENSESEQKTTTDNKRSEKPIDDAIVTSTEDSVQKLSITEDSNKQSSTTAATTSVAVSSVNDKPSTSNGEVEVAEEDDEVTQSLQLAWQVLELAAKIFSRQGINGLPNLAEVQTELANIQFENNYLEAAREDYEKALKIYKDLPASYRRAKAEIHYKIGLTFLMQQIHSEGATSLKEACSLIEDEIAEMQSKENVTENDKNVIKDMEETKQEIWAKITEIEETRQQNLKDIRGVLDTVIYPGGKPIQTDNDSAAGPSSTSALKPGSTTAPSSSTAITSSSSKPKDISHLIKRKKPDSEVNSEAEAVASPAKKRPI